MRNRLTFANIISILLENKKKTYQQHQLVRNLFSAYLNDELPSGEIYAEYNTMYSRWCTGTRPIPMEILHIYEDNNFEVMEEDFRCKIIPNLINESQARSQIEELINDSRNIIGNKTADEMLALTDNAAFLLPRSAMPFCQTTNTAAYFHLIYPIPYKIAACLPLRKNL